MIKFYKHIAILLFGIFISPIIFQPVHILWHHSHSFNECNHVCTTKSDSHGLDNESKNGIKKYEHCPICEYKFSINNLPIVSVFETIVPKIDANFDETEIAQLYLHSFSVKSPRAPPFSVA